MPDKPKKKPKHTNLALPTDKKRTARKSPAAKPDRLGRKVGGPTAGHGDARAQHGVDAVGHTPVSDAQPGAAGRADSPAAQAAPPKAAAAVENEAAKAVADDAAPAHDRNTQAAAQGAQRPAGPPDNTILLPKKRPGISKAKRRKRRRRLGFLAFVLAVAMLVLFYFSGLYLNAAMGLGDLYDTARIALTPGDGFPMDFAMTGFWKADELGAGGFAALGSKDMAVFSGTGTELRRIQHGYANPGITASDTRVCVYSRGGRDYAVESRSGSIVRKTTEQDILFAEMSRGGWLALVTSSRYRANLAIYNPLYGAQPQLQWPIIDDKPVCAAFHQDNRTLALGCLTAENGALGSVIYVLRADSDKLSAAIPVPDARVLQLSYISANRLLAVFDTYAAVYDSRGAEQARFDYGGRTLRSADTNSGKTALVFGENNQETLELVLLSNQMVPLFSVQAAGNSVPHVLVATGGVYLETGYEVLAYTEKGAPGGTLAFEAKPYALVRAPEPVLLTATSALPLGSLLNKENISSASPGLPATSSSAAQDTGATEPPGGQSMPPGEQPPEPEPTSETLPEGTPAESSTE